MQCNSRALSAFLLLSAFACPGARAFACAGGDGKCKEHPKIGMSEESSPTETKVTLNLDGLHCSSCVKKVQAALRKLKGVSKVDVSLKENRAEIRYVNGSVSRERLIAAIEDSGYKVVDKL